MLKIPSYLALAVAVVWPSIAAAQTASTSADIAYCKALSARYMTLYPKSTLPSGAVSVAVSRCDTDPRDSIKTLEAKLRNSAGRLPPREQFARERQQ
jgi:hypothetical protein